MCNSVANLQGRLTVLEFALFEELHGKALQQWLRTGKGPTPGSLTWPKAILVGVENGR